MTFTGRSGTVRRTASAMNASVPSEPTRRCAKTSTGRLEVEERVQRVAGRVLHPVLRADAAGERRRRRGDRARNSRRPCRERRLLRAERLVRVGSRRVDRPCRTAGRTSATRACGTRSATTPQHMPLALFATMPPIVHVAIEAGSGPIFRPNGLQEPGSTCAPITPGWTRILAPPSSTCSRRKCARTSRRGPVRDGLAREARPRRAEVERDRPARAEPRRGARTSSAFARPHDRLRDEAVEARVGGRATVDQVERSVENLFRRQDRRQLLLGERHRAESTALAYDSGVDDPPGRNPAAGSAPKPSTSTARASWTCSSRRRVSRASGSCSARASGSFSRAGRPAARSPRSTAATRRRRGRSRAQIALFPRALADRRAVGLLRRDDEAPLPGLFEGTR